MSKTDGKRSRRLWIGGLQAIHFVKAFVISALITAVMLLFCAFLLLKTGLSDQVLGIVLAGVDALAVFAGRAAGYALRIIPGVEISADYKNGDIHILGLFIEPSDSALAFRLQVFAGNIKGSAFVEIAAECLRTAFYIAVQLKKTGEMGARE